MPCPLDPALVEEFRTIAKASFPGGDAYPVELVYAHADSPLLEYAEVPARKLKADQVWLLEDGHCVRTQVTHFCRLLHAPGEPGLTAVEPQMRSMNEAQRIRKVVVELVETERQYVKVSHLHCLCLSANIVSKSCVTCP